jgi:uncharacterized RDD family membrane protein YckC
MSLVTPEGVVVQYSLADAGSRLGAATIDLAIQLLMMAILAIPAAFGNVGIAFAVVAWFIVLFGYPTAFDLWGDGRTIGKRAMGLQVRMANGAAVGFIPSCIRNFLRFVDFLPAFGVVGVVFILATKKHQRLGDIAGSTVVVRPVRLVNPATGPGAMPLAGRWDPSMPIRAVMPQEIALLDVSLLSGADVATIQSFLVRRWTLDPFTRSQLAHQFASAISPRVAGLPGGIDAERALELMVAAKTLR